MNQQHHWAILWLYRIGIENVQLGASRPDLAHCAHTAHTTCSFQLSAATHMSRESAYRHGAVLGLYSRKTIRRNR